MTTKITVQLNDEEIEMINKVSDLLTEMYNELVIDEKQNKEQITLLNQTQQHLDDIVYKFCNDHYKEIHY